MVDGNQSDIVNISSFTLTNGQYLPFGEGIGRVGSGLVAHQTNVVAEDLIIHNNFSGCCGAAIYFDNADGDLYIRTKTAGTPINAIAIESAGDVTFVGNPI